MSSVVQFIPRTKGGAGGVAGGGAASLEGLEPGLEPVALETKSNGPGGRGREVYKPRCRLAGVDTAATAVAYTFNMKVLVSTSPVVAPMLTRAPPHRIYCHGRCFLFALPAGSCAVVHFIF